LKTHEQQQQQEEETLPPQEGREKEEEEVAKTVEQHPKPLVKKSGTVVPETANGS
jgi:hypothetical protein